MLYLVEESKAKVVDGLSLPLWERRVEGDGIGLEHAQWEGHNHSISTENIGAPVVTGTSIHLHTYICKHACMHAVNYFCI